MNLSATVLSALLLSHMSARLQVSRMNICYGQTTLDERNNSNIISPHIPLPSPAQVCIFSFVIKSQTEYTSQAGEAINNGVDNP